MATVKWTSIVLGEDGPSLIVSDLEVDPDSFDSTIIATAWKIVLKEDQEAERAWKSWSWKAGSKKPLVLSAIVAESRGIRLHSLLTALKSLVMDDLPWETESISIALMANDHRIKLKGTGDILYRLHDYGLIDHPDAGIEEAIEAYSFD